MNDAEAPTERARLVFFCSPVDGRSRRVEALLAQVLERRQNFHTFSFYKVDVTRRPDLAERFGVEEIPTLLVIDDRRVKGRLVRPTGTKPIAALLAPWLH